MSRIYNEYRTPPWLQLHQLRTAAVGKIVAEMCDDADVSLVVTSCLLHDMGAIVKFDLSDNSPLKNLLPVNERDYWCEVQHDFRERYGMKEHLATDAVLQELNQETVRHLLSQTGLSHMRDMLVTRNMNVWIVQYADGRIGPDGVLSVVDRLRDVENRYQDSSGPERYASYGYIVDMALEMEHQLFANTGFRPADITDALIEPLIESLRTYEI